MKQIPVNFAAFIGLDWADQKHDFCLKCSDSESLEYGIFQHTPEAIEEWALSIQKRFKDQPVAICLELKAGPLVYALLKYNFIVLFPIPPMALSKYREAFSPSGAKDDPTDAFLQLDYLLKHPESLKPLNPDTVDTRIIQRMVEDRRTLVGEKVRLTNRITAALKSYFPQALEWFSDLDTILFCDFIQRWSTLNKARKARPATLTRFFKEHRCVRQAVIDKRLTAIKKTMPLTEDEGVIIPFERLVKVFALQLQQLIVAIRDYDLNIAKRFRAHADNKIFDSLPGAGPVFGPRLLAAFGSDRTRFNSADEVCRLSGIAPVLERSGKKCWVHWRYSCPVFLRQTFVEWANQSIRYSFWAKEFYDEKRASGKSHQATLRALAFKWIHILFRCWKDKTPYDESAYLFALKRRNKMAA
ncbi:Mobile element protein [hydrothermal vent metagenome]|uniref:Mobile element protein n=1 Tax=hydrothermal vent metagenome TaxID=652676 RepID=A0A3B0ZB14_9ZZZZ